MEGFGGSGFNSASAVMKKRRSATSRRPRPDSQRFLESHDISPPSSTPSSDNANKYSPDESSGYDAGGRRKEFYLNGTVSKVSSVNRMEGLNASKRIKKVDKSYGEFDGIHGNSSSRDGVSESIEQGRNVLDLKRCSEGVLAPANWKNTSKVKDTSEMLSRSPDGYIDSGRCGSGRNMGPSVSVPNGSAENRRTKVKLKLVGGVTHTLQAKSNLESGSDGASSTKPPRCSDAPRHRQKLILQENSDDDDNSPPDRGNGLHGIPWKDFRGGGFSHMSKDTSRGKVTEEGITGKHTDKSQSLATSEPVRKSKRVPKRRVLDGEFEDGDEDDEIRYLEKLKSSKVSVDYGAGYGDDGLDSVKKHKTLKSSKSRKSGYNEDEDYDFSRRSKEGMKKSRSERESEDMDYIEEEELGSDDGLEAKRRKQKKETVDTGTDGKKEIALTTRQRALQSGKDGSGGNGASLIEFPNGLPPVPPRKQKEKLSEVEQQLKKAEAAQRRRMQVEKAARESEAEAIRKILGQDSNRKKREEKLRKRRDELAQEKAANYLALPSNTVRWVMGPTGTTVIFPESLGLPSIFDAKPCSYPPPREKCVGPSCTNTYKYRDSKSNLPLCSLQCYRAVQQSVQPPQMTC